MHFYVEKLLKVLKVLKTRIRGNPASVILSVSSVWSLTFQHFMFSLLVFQHMINFVQHCEDFPQLAKNGVDFLKGQFIHLLYFLYQKKRGLSSPLRLNKFCIEGHAVGAVRRAKSMTRLSGLACRVASNSSFQHF